jgi:hypothetical protein
MDTHKISSIYRAKTRLFVKSITRNVKKCCAADEKIFLLNNNESSNTLNIDIDKAPFFPYNESSIKSFWELESGILKGAILCI